MDPLSISASIVSLAAKFISISNRCYTLYEKDKLAFITINALSNQSRSIKTFLDGINHLLTDRRSSSRIQELNLPNWHESLAAAVDGCRLVYDLLEAEVQKLGPIDSKKSIRLRQRARLHWNEGSLRNLSGILDSQVGAVRCLLDVLRTSLLIPIQMDQVTPELRHQAAKFQHHLIENDEKLEGLFSDRAAVEEKETKATRKKYMYDKYAASLVYRRYRDNMDCIRSIYSKEDNDIRSTSADSDDFDRYSYSSSTQLISRSQKNPEYREDNLPTDNDLAAASAEKCGHVEKCAGLAGLNCDGADSESDASFGQQDDIGLTSRSSEPVLVSDLWQQLGVSAPPIDGEDVWYTTESDATPARQDLGSLSSRSFQRVSILDLLSQRELCTPALDDGNVRDARGEISSSSSSDAEGDVDLRKLDITVVGTCTG
jgi:hypothetical protein